MTQNPLRSPIITVAGHVDHGKCVSADTIIPLSDGTLITAKELFDSKFNEKKAKKIDDGILQEITKENIKVFSFNGKNIIRKTISHIWKRQSEKLIEIKTASGDIIKTTPEHPFFLFGIEKLKETRADKINKGDSIAIPKVIRFESSKIEPILMKKIITLNNFVGFISEEIYNKIEGLVDKKYKSLEKKLSIKHIRDSLKERRFRIKDLFNIAKELNLSEEYTYNNLISIKNANEGWRVGHTSKPLVIPRDYNLEKLGYILGCIAGDGHISKNQVILNNNDKEIQEAYKEHLKEIFKLESKTKQSHTCEITLDNGGTTFVRFFTDILDFPKKEKSGNIEVPEIARKNNEIFKGFLAGLFDTDGYVSHINNSIEITSKSKKMLTQCSILLLQFEIQSVIFEKNGYYTLRIANKKYIGNFINTFKPRLKRKLDRIVKAFAKAESSRIFDFFPINGKILKSLVVNGKINRKVPYFNKYASSLQLSTQLIESTLNNLKESNSTSINLKDLLEKEVQYVKVTSIKEIINKENYVYDFTVPDTHNFIAERTLVHNTSLLDCFRGSSVQEKEAGGITQKISFTKYPFDQIIKVCPLIEKAGIELKIPGFLFIDTPGHAAFTNLRQRGGSLADIMILVVDIKEGIQPQTAEVISILKANKTPFIIALNKIDKLSGWRKESSIKKSLESLPSHAKDEFVVALGTFQSSLQSHGFNSSLFYELSDFTKEIAIVPCSARTKEGIPEILLVLCGLSQRFLTNRLTLSEESKGIILEIKKEKSMETAEAILYDGNLKEGDKIGIATLSGDLIVTKIRSIEEVLPLSFKFKSVSEVWATTGIKMQLTNKDEILSGMPFQKLTDNEKELKEKFAKEFKDTLSIDKEGIIVKADSLGSLEALLTLLKQSNIQVVRAGIGQIEKADLVVAKANIELNPLNAIILGFNVEKEKDLPIENIKILTNQVVYRLIDDLNLWRKEKNAQIEKKRMMELSNICKLEILHQYQFRNSNPAIFGVRVLAGGLKKNISIIDESDEQISRIKAIQEEKESVEEATENKEVAISLPGVNFERQLADKKYLYSQLSESQFKIFKKNKDLLSESEIKAISEIVEIKRKKKSEWGK